MTLSWDYMATFQRRVRTRLDSRRLRILIFEHHVLLRMRPLTSAYFGMALLEVHKAIPREVLKMCTIRLHRIYYWRPRRPLESTLPASLEIDIIVPYGKHNWKPVKSLSERRWHRSILHSFQLDCSTRCQSSRMTQIYANPLASVDRPPTLLMLLPGEHKAWCEQVRPKSHSIHFDYLIRYISKVCPRRVQCRTCHLPTNIQGLGHRCVQRSPSTDPETGSRLGSGFVWSLTKRCIQVSGNLCSFYGRSASQCALLSNF